MNYAKLKVYSTTFRYLQWILFTIFWVGLPGLFLLSWCFVLYHRHFNELFEVFPWVPFFIVIWEILLFVAPLSFFILFIVIWTFTFLWTSPERIKTLSNYVLHITFLLPVNQPMVLNWKKYTLNSKGNSWCISKHKSLHWFRYLIELDSETRRVS